jgi:hypothetical protein
VDNNNEQWVYNGVEFKPGDKALIAFLGIQECFTLNGMGEGVDWDNKWVERMDYAVGGVHEIESIDEFGVEFVEYVDDMSLHPHQGFRYPLSVLVKQ